MPSETKLPLYLNSPKAKAQLSADMAKGGTKAKTAMPPLSNQKLAQKIKLKKQMKSKLSAPGELARCREIVGGDLRAAALLYRIAYLWRTINPRLHRHNKEWVAMSSADWAVSAGLSESEMTKYALPRLRTYSLGVVEIRAMGRGKDKKLWACLDPAGYAEALGEAGYELKAAANDGIPPFKPKVLPFPIKPPNFQD